MIEIVPATVAHAESLAPRLRCADLEEIKAGSGEDPLKVLKDGIRVSVPCKTALRDGLPIAIFGVVPEVPGMYGRIWLLGSDDLKDVPLEFCRTTRKVLKEFHQDYPVMGNVVDERNFVHTTWLKWAGFTFLRRIKHYGPEGLPFLEFARMKDV
jgi:hypothetical protein